MVTEAVAKPVTGILEAIQPFQADDGHKGTFFILRVAGLEQATALRLIKRRYRSLQNWRAIDADFRRIDDAVPALIQQFSGEARVLRTALLDISIVETGIMIFKQILTKQPVSSDMFAYATKMAGLRVPMMSTGQPEGNPWERLANSIKSTLESPLSHRELTVVRGLDGSQSVTAKETIIEPSPEQRQITNDIVQKILGEQG